MIGWERGKKILVPNSVKTQSGQENSEKNSKKILKIEKPLSGISFSQNGGWERVKKILVPNSVPTQPKLENSKKIQKIKKVNSDIICIQNGLREIEKERKKI